MLLRPICEAVQASLRFRDKRFAIRLTEPGKPPEMTTHRQD